jgi:glycosyltransferase involved in cell wall biosynthesis
MRYLWEHFAETRAETPWLARPFLDCAASYLRTWDHSTAARVDRFIANSANVKRRIRKVYRRRSQVVYPPVATHLFYNKPAEDYFLTVGELVSYKNFDYVVRYCAAAGRKLKVVGQGPQYRALRRMANAHVEFCGHVADEELRELYARCAALIVPGEEDFGITTVEALASGKPVIALARGGSLEIVESGCGVFYEEPAENSLANAVRIFDGVAAEIEPQRARVRASRFSESAFERDFQAALDPRRQTSGEQSTFPRAYRRSA